MNMFSYFNNLKIQLIVISLCSLIAIKSMAIEPDTNLQHCPLVTSSQDEIVHSEMHQISLFGRQYQYQQVISPRMKRSRRVRASSLKTHPKDQGQSVFIGFSNNGHIYVVAGDRRYDPDFFFRRNGLSHKALLSRGLVVRLTRRDFDLSSMVEKHLPDKENLPHVFNCVEGTCRILNSSIFSSGNPQPKTTLYPQKLLRHLLEVSEQESGLQVDLFFLGQGDLKTYLKKMNRRTYFYTSLPFIALAISHYLRVEVFELTLNWGPF